MNTQTLSATTRRQQRGISLVESLIVLAVTTVSLGAAMPSFQEAVQRRHFDGVAAQLETDFQQARSMAVLQNRNLRVTFFRDHTGSCYVIHDGPANACRCNDAGPAVCNAPYRAMHRVLLPSGSGVQLSSNVPSMVLDATRGTVTPTGTVRIEGGGDRAVNVVVNLLGRVRSCSPNGSVPGYKPC